MREEALFLNFRHSGLVAAHVIMVATALIINLLGDRSFGSLMLSTLPISLVSVLCLLIGPWLSERRRRTAWNGWLTGVILVLMISLVFFNLGAEQAKTGELVFTYAALFMSLPLSLILPFVMAWAEPLLQGSTLLRLLVAWIVCVLAGGATWWTLCWLQRNLQRHKRSSTV